MGWSMSSLMTALPEFPSHSLSHSDNATQFSTPRNQRFGIDYCMEEDNNNSSTCFSDINEWLEHANKFCKPFDDYHTCYTHHHHHLTEETFDHSRRGNGSPEEYEEESAICSSDFLNITAPPDDDEHQLYNIILPSVREESPVFHGRGRRTHHHHLASCINRHGHSRRQIMSRHKPYDDDDDEFLNEVKRKNREAVRDARNKAKHLELIHRLRRKEYAINDWEVQQTRKAMHKMDKIQNELERKQLMASARTQKKICLVREKAEKQKLNLRRSTIKKLQQLQKPETHSPSEIAWGSRLPF